MAIEAFPDEYTSYVLLAPLLSDPHEAIKFYTQALALQGDDENPTSKKPSTTTNQFQESALTLTQIHCAIAELWITDLCNEQDADKMAAEHLARAEAEDPFSAEVPYLQAQLALNKSDRKMALITLEQAISRLHIIPKEDGEAEEQASMPSPELVIQIAKLCIELGSYQQSIPLLEWSLELQEGLPDLHYLLGFALLSLSKNENEEQVSLGREYLLTAKKVNRYHHLILAHSKPL